VFWQKSAQVVENKEGEPEKERKREIKSAQADEKKGEVASDEWRERPHTTWQCGWLSK
jgi:hypothetical protein